MACTEQRHADHSAPGELQALGGGGAGRAGCGCADVWRVAAAEALGTALLVLLTCLPGCAAGEGETPPAPLVQRALGAGLTVALLVECFDHVSGAQLNPAVTLAAALAGRLGAARAGAVCAAQLAGGALGAAGALALGGGGARGLARCVTVPGARVGAPAALATEALLGACLALANLAAWDARNRRLVDSWPLRIGFTVAALSLAAGDVTGASMNPARSFAPALLSARWDHLWIYWVGPLAGSAAASALYAAAWRAPPRAPPRAAPSPVPPHRKVASLDVGYSL